MKTQPPKLCHTGRSYARFLPDGKNVAFTGTEPGHKSRIYVQVIDSGTARPISPEGVSGFVPTADGKFVFGFSDSVALYPVDGQGTPRPVPGIHPDEAILSVSRDGRSVLVGMLGRYSADVMRVDRPQAAASCSRKSGHRTRQGYRCSMPPLPPTAKPMPIPASTL